MATATVKRGHRKDDVGQIIRKTHYYIQNIKHDMVILKFQDDETFGYNVDDVKIA